MKTDFRRKVGLFWYIWVICPVCKEGRWTQESRSKMPHFTGRCKKCYVDIARQELSGQMRRKEA